MTDHTSTPANRLSPVASRRDTLRCLAGAGLAAMVLPAAAPRLVQAQATPAAAAEATTAEGPRRYVLSSDGVEITFEPGHGTGEPKLAYSDNDTSVTAAGDDVEIAHQQALGRSASAFVNAVADGYVRYVTLLVPDVNPPEEGSDVPIETLAILTTHLTSIAGPAMLKGAVHTYEAIALSGSAEFEPA